MYHVLKSYHSVKLTCQCFLFSHEVG